MTPEDLPPGPVLLDTDAASWIHRGSLHAERFAPFVVNRVNVLSFATVGELRVGAGLAGWGEVRRRELEDFIGRCVVLPADNATVNAWVTIHQAVRGQVGTNDEWIAASALSRTPPLPVITGNARHFDRIAAATGLIVVSPPVMPPPVTQPPSEGSPH